MLCFPNTGTNGCATAPAPSAAVSLSAQRPPASHRLPLPSDHVVTAEKGIRALLSLSSSLWVTNFSNGASPGCHRWKTGNVEPDLPTAKLRLRRLQWLQGGTSRPGAIGSVGARGTRPKPRPGSLRSLPQRTADLRPRPHGYATVRAYRLASLFRRTAGQRCGLPESQTRPGPDSARPQRARARVPAETGPPKLRHTRGRSRGRAAILPPPWPAARDSPFSSNKDINPTRLARDWEEEALETGSGAAGPAASGGAAGQVPPPSSGRDCPSDVRVHTSSAEPGDLAGTRL